MNTFSRVLQVPLFMAAAISAFSSQSPSPAAANLVPRSLEVAGIVHMGDGPPFVYVVYDGLFANLRAVGQSIGPYKLVNVDPQAKFAEFEFQGEVQRIPTRNGTISLENQTNEPTPATIEQVKQRLAVVGGVLTERQLEGMAKAVARSEARIRERIMKDPALSVQEKEKQIRELSQKRALVIGPKGMSKAEAEVLGIDVEQREYLNYMNGLGKHFNEKPQPADQDSGGKPK